MNQQNQNKTSNILSTSKKEKLEKNNNKNFTSKNSGSLGFAFLNDYTSFTEKDNNKNTKNNNSNNNTELIELKEKYEKIVNDILNEEKNCLESHKSHIDNMVLTMKNEMNLINIVEQKSNVDEYVDEMLNIFGEQENKINAMKQKLLGFKRLLKEENELSQKISALSENNNNNCNSNTKNENNSFDNNCINEDKKSIKIDEINQECMKFLSLREKKYEEPIKKNIEMNYENIVKHFLETILKREGRQFYENWFEILFNLITKAISKLSPSFRDLRDSLDINDYIKIKTINCKKRRKKNRIYI